MSQSRRLQSTSFPSLFTGVMQPTGWGYGVTHHEEPHHPDPRRATGIQRAAFSPEAVWRLAQPRGLRGSTRKEGAAEGSCCFCSGNRDLACKIIHRRGGLVLRQKAVTGPVANMNVRQLAAGTLFKCLTQSADRTECVWAPSMACVHGLHNLRYSGDKKETTSLSSGLGNKTSVVLLLYTWNGGSVQKDWAEHLKESPFFSFAGASSPSCPFPCEPLISAACTFFLADHTKSHEIISCHLLSLYPAQASPQSFRAAHSAAY